MSTAHEGERERVSEYQGTTTNHACVIIMLEGTSRTMVVVESRTLGRRNGPCSFSGIYLLSALSGRSIDDDLAR